MMPIAHMVEWVYKMLAPYGMKVPQFTPSRIRLLSCCRTFNCSKANDLLGYTPVVSLQVTMISIKPVNFLHSQLCKHFFYPSKLWSLLTISNLYLQQSPFIKYLVLYNALYLCFAFFFNYCFGCFLRGMFYGLYILAIHPIMRSSDWKEILICFRLMQQM